MKIHVINGPNLNMLSKRDPKFYTGHGYDEMVKKVKDWCDKKGVEVDFFQSNHEGALIDYIQSLSDNDAIIINPGAFAHYSYALHDALEIFNGVKVEVHISNVFKRENFRTKSVTAAACDGVIIGFGFEGYTLAAEFIISKKL